MSLLPPIPPSRYPEEPEHTVDKASVGSSEPIAVEPLASPVPADVVTESEPAAISSATVEAEAAAFGTVFASPKPVVAPLLFSPEIQAAAQRLMDYIGDDECSEVLLNGPNEVSRKIRGARYHCPDVAFGDAETYHRVINEILLPFTDTTDRIDGVTVVMEGQLELEGLSGRAPMLARVHLIAPPGVQFAKVTIAKKPRYDLTLDDLASNGTLSVDGAEFLKASARGRKTIVVSGPTGAGKTTTLQAITHCFDANDRVVVIEETPELRLPLGDVVYLRATLQRPGMETSQIYTLDFWTKQANRMRMDRVIVGETRGGEMADWLIAANSGADGSATTVHANSPRRALDKILALATKSETATSEAQLRREIAATVALIVQVGLVENRHMVLAIEEISETIAQATGQIQTNTIFEYDRTLNKMVPRGRPSDEYIASLAAVGVPVNPEWFRQV
jgi:pilus assembly protein CpaF